MINRLLSCTLVIVLGFGAGTAGAGDRHRGGYDDVRSGHHHLRHRHAHRPDYRIGYRPHYRYGHRYRYYYPPYAGVALLAGPLTYRFYHTHQGAVCYRDHYRDSGGRWDGNRR